MAEHSCSTLASRQPESTIQSSRIRPALTQVQKATRKIGRNANIAKEKLFSADIHELVAQRDAMIVTLAEKHSKSPEYVNKILSTASAYKKQRKPNLHNARTHYKAVMNNSNGEHANLQELQRMARDDSDLEDLTEKQEDELKQTLLDHRESKRTGTRPNNRSAALDTFTTLDRIQAEIHNLHARTGTCCFAFFSRGHIDDQGQPEFIETGSSLQFLSQVLQLDPWDVLRRYELWSCGKEIAVQPVDTPATIRAECVKIILSGLRFASKSKVVTMSYTNYSTAIVLEHKVQLVGWTYLKIVSPSEISSMQDLRPLRDALRSGACKWIRMTKAQLTEYKAELEVQGDVTKKKRKERSDKGLKRKRVSAENGDSDDKGPTVPPKNAPAGPSRSQRTKLPPKSKSIISDSGSDSSE